MLFKLILEGIKKFPFLIRRTGREMEEPHWNMTFSMGETSFSIAVNTKEDVLKEIEKNKKACYPPVQMDWAKYLGMDSI